VLLRTQTLSQTKCLFENCSLLAYYAKKLVISYRRFGTTMFNLKKRPICCPEKLVRNCHYSLCNNPEEQRSHLLRWGRLKSPIRVYLWRPWGHCFNPHTIFMRCRTRFKFTFKAYILRSSRTHCLLTDCYYRSLGQDVTSNKQIMLCFGLFKGHPVAQLVEALRYKPEGRGFDSHVVTGIFLWHNPSGHTMALVLTQPVTEIFPGGKAAGG